MELDETQSGYLAKEVKDTFEIVLVPNLAISLIKRANSKDAAQMNVDADLTETQDDVYL